MRTRAHRDASQQQQSSWCWCIREWSAAFALTMAFCGGVRAAEEQPVPPDIPGQAPSSAVPQSRTLPGKIPVARLGVGVKQRAPNDSQPGLQVAIVVKGSPAQKSGLLPDDVITHFDDQILFAPIQLEMLVKRSEVGANVRLTYHRNSPDAPLKTDVVLDGATQAPVPSHPEAVLADRFQVTGRVVRVTTGNTTMALSTRKGRAYLVIVAQNEIRFEGPVENDDDIPQDLLEPLQRVAKLESGKWNYYLPLQPPVRLAPDEGPKAPAPEDD